MLKLIGKKEFDVFWDQGAQLKCTACVTPLREHLDTVVLQLELEPCLAVFIRGYYLILKKGRKVTKSLRWIFLLQKVYFELLFQIKWLRCVNIFGSFLLSASYLVFALVWFFFLSIVVAVVRGEFWMLPHWFFFLSFWLNTFPGGLYFCWQLWKSIFSLSLISLAICISGVLPFAALSVVTHPSAASSLLESWSFALSFSVHLMSSGRCERNKCFFFSLNTLFLISTLFVYLFVFCFFFLYKYA